MATPMMVAVNVYLLFFLSPVAVILSYSRRTAGTLRSWRTWNVGPHLASTPEHLYGNLAQFLGALGRLNGLGEAKLSWLHTLEHTRITQKFVLCQLPPQWEVLPVHRGPKPPSHPNSIAVYTNNGPNSSLIYKGYICPSHPTQVPMTSLMPPTEKSLREQLFESRYLQLVEKVRAKDSEAQAQARTLPVVSSQSNCTRAAEAQTRSLTAQAQGQVNGSRAAETPTRTILVQNNQQNNNIKKADSTTSSTTRPVVVKAESSATQNQEDGSSNKVGKAQNSSYPLPYDILSGGESFLAHEEPWGNPEEEDVIEMITL